MIQAQLGIGMTYLITCLISHFRGVWAYVSIFTNLLSNVKAALEPKLFLRLLSRCPPFPLRLVQEH